MSSININRINEILFDLTSISEKYAFKKVNIETNKGSWLNSNLSAIKEERILDISKDNNLEIKVNTEKQVYLSYEENTIKFSNVPNIELDLIEGKTYKVKFDADVKGELNARVYIIGYDDNEKIQQCIIDIGKETEIKIDERCKKFRVALRFVGIGELRVKEICFYPVKMDLTSKDIITSSYEHINYKRIIRKISEVKIACVLDEFSFTSFSRQCEMITFTPFNFIEVLEKNPPDFLLVESAWKGIDSSWEFRIAKYNNQDKKPLYSLLSYCKSKGIPTVFWNKEDPIHFDKFIDTAKLFDYIFTTDRNIIPKYKEFVDHDNVYSLSFAAQVKTHNPIKKYVRKKGVCFAGSYYGNRHEDRKRDMDNVLQACKSYGLDIYDRNYNVTKENPNSPFRYPMEFNDNVKGSLPYSEIDKAYKGYEVMLNVNSVKDSPTMFSRRVFEGLACGTPIISTYSKGINEMFGDLIISDDDKDKLIEKIDKLMKDSQYWKKLSVKGIRNIMFKHTYENRIRYLLSKLDIYIEPPNNKVSIIKFVRSEEEIVKFESSKVVKKYINSERVYIATELFDGYIDCLNRYNTKYTRFYIGEYIENNYKVISDIASGDYIAYMDDKNVYGENYLIDLIAATQYTDANIIGKKSYYSYSSNEVCSRGKGNKKKNKIVNLINLKSKDGEYIFTSSIKLDRCIIEKSFIWNTPLKTMLNEFRSRSTSEELFSVGAKIFSIDNNNFIENIDESKINSDDHSMIFI